MTDSFEKVKIEIRSILLSSKHGVAATDVQNDYEQLTCQRLLHKELGFDDVQSLMRAMPDVAKEVRLPTGQITYHAVCDESTAHIQKLVRNQTSKKKNTKYSRGRGRGGFRRGYGLGRGGHFARGSLVGSAKPRFHLTSNRSQPLRSFPASSHAVHSSCGNRNESFSSHSRGHLTKDGDWDNTVKDEDRQPLQNSRAVVGRGISSAEQTKSDIDSDDLTRISSYMYNLKIGVNQTGKRVISKFDSPVGRSSDSGDFNADDSVSAPNTQFDLRDVINKRRAQHAAAEDNYSENNGAVGGKDFKLDAGRNRRVMKDSKHPFKKNLPPRLQRQHDQLGDSLAQKKKVLVPTPIPNKPHPHHFSEENTIYSIEKSNWVPPENGELYLQTYYNYFAQRGEEAPEIVIIDGKCHSQRGYYGCLLHNDKNYYPLEIMQFQEQARQNVARSFCIKNDIPLLTTEQDKLTQNELSSGVSHIEQSGQDDQSVAEPNNTKSHLQVEPSQVPLQLQPPHSGDVSTPARNKQCLPEILEKVYKMLKPNGIWVSMIANLYQATYEEAFTMDFMSLASKWPDYFTLEQLAKGRFTVYPVPNALTKETAVNIINEVKPNEENKIYVPVPPALQLLVSSEVEVMFSFAYSAEDMYVQRADMENLIYEIDEILNCNCPGNSAPEVDAVTMSCLMAANYEDGWYRAQVMGMEIPMVTVYFIDYGNREKVNISNLRPIPQEQLTLNTPSLAIKCTVRKSKVGEWCNDVNTILTELAENHPTFSARILEHKGDQHIIDLHTPEGNLVNDMLVQPAAMLTPQQITTPQRTGSLEQEKIPFVGSPSNKLFADDPELNFNNA